MELFEFAVSGNCHKVRMLLSMLNLEYTSRIVNGAEREQKSENFLTMNPFGQVPVLKDKEVVIRDSQAILVYLAIEYGKEEWFPISGIGSAKVMEWLSTAANEVARGPAALRSHYKFGRPLNLEEATAISNQLLHLLEIHLEKNFWLVDKKPTIADLAMYPYIALAPEAKIDLKPYDKIRQWLQRVESLPGYVSMPGIELQKN
ncbi:glutathione S-transferase N-terminal domain-containing protein [Leptospira sp. 201903071]|uniref:glutathione S-transferase family protein n=1 Tax=Leptospira ainazelensis TaxID=2810034 RepID=UPI0019633843|nr:glutathione S-transferase N-terminal domain-containing protein [Leptospira ainazelensis]